MARSFVIVEKPGSAAFILAMNTALALLTDPVIVGVSYNVDERQRRDQRQYSGVISYDTGGSALATPFLVSVLEANSPAELATALAAFVAANPAAFIAHTEYLYLYTEARAPKYIAVTIYNATGGASAHYIPL